MQQAVIRHCRTARANERRIRARSGSDEPVLRFRFPLSLRGSVASWLRGFVASWPPHYTIDVIELKVQDGGVLLGVKVVPGASRTAILGEWNARLRIAVAAAPEKGKANAELCAFLAKRLGLKKSEVTVIQGQTTPLKRVRFARLTPAEIFSKLDLHDLWSSRESP